ncbi:MAG: hypothetical protein IV084_09375 [Rugosibacter sp.]|nr:hypothetical protein [Rugosibacter sp.]
MYIIAIGWLYITLLMAATEPSLTAGVLTFILYGALPLGLLLWLLGTPQRRRNQGKKTSPQTSHSADNNLAQEVIDREMTQENRPNPRAD